MEAIEARESIKELEETVKQYVVITSNRAKSRDGMIYDLMKLNPDVDPKLIYESLLYHLSNVTNKTS